MAGFTDYMENALLDGVFGNAAYPATNATVYVGLSTAAPNDGGTVTEISGSGYARATVAASGWASAAGGTTANNAAVAFPGAAADWGTASHFHAWTAATAGSMILFGSLSTNQNIPSGGTATFASGSLKWTLD